MAVVAIPTFYKSFSTPGRLRLHTKNKVYYDKHKATNNMFNDFTSNDTHKFKFKIGRGNASSLSGFITGVIAASIVWFAAIWILKGLSLL